MTWGIPIGLFVIVFTVLITGIYVRRANSEFDALTREIRPGRQGKVETTVQEVRADAQAPPAPERVDLFGTPRAILLWSGLVAGSLLALAFMLRPLLRR